MLEGAGEIAVRIAADEPFEQCRTILDLRCVLMDRTHDVSVPFNHGCQQIRTGHHTDPAASGINDRHRRIIINGGANELAQIVTFGEGPSVACNWPVGTLEVADRLHHRMGAHDL